MLDSKRVIFCISVYRLLCCMMRLDKVNSWAGIPLSAKDCLYINGMYSLRQVGLLRI